MSETKTAMSRELISDGLVISILQDVLKRWYLVVATALIAMMVAFMVSDASYEAQYRTTTTFVATASGTSTTTFTNLSAANDFASVFEEILNSSLLKKKVLEEVGITNFHGTINASVIESTNLLTMTVTGNDPSIVFQVTKAIIDNHHFVSAEVLNNNILEVLQSPSVPTMPINRPTTERNVKVAGLAACVAMAGFLGTLSFFADKVRSREEADHKLSCHVLGELYHERKRKNLKEFFNNKKKSILITDPLTSFVYTESIHKLSSRLDKRRHKGEHIIMVTSLLENEGKSTVAVNLALSMAERGKRVLLVDGDMRKPACHLILNQSNKNLGVTDILHGNGTVHECAFKLENSDLYLLTAKRSQRTAVALVGTSAMEVLLNEAADEFDFVIVDTPPMSIAPDAECISEFADAALLVVRQNVALAEDLEETVSILERSNAHLLGCVLNNVFGSNRFAPAFNYGRYGYGKYGRYTRYGKYGYGKYGYGKASKSGEKA